MESEKMKISRHADWERKRGLVFQHRENSALPFRPLNSSLLALFRRMEKRARNWSWCNLHRIRGTHSRFLWPWNRAGQEETKRKKRMIGRSLESCPLGPGKSTRARRFTRRHRRGSAWKCVPCGAFFLLMSHPRATKVVPPDDPD